MIGLNPKNKILIDSWNETKNKYKEKYFTYKVRDKEIAIETQSTHYQEAQFLKFHYQNMKPGEIC